MGDSSVKPRVLAEALGRYEAAQLFPLNFITEVALFPVTIF